jgi:peptidoglycan/xylan/chitin deacetylase (PgdA/CDA1 family)
MKTLFSITVDVEPDYWNGESTIGVVQGIPDILSLLESLGSKATFFWTAVVARKHPDILEWVISEGHEIACHGLNHENLAALEKRRQSEIIEEAASVFRSLGISCDGFRAPRLRVNESLFEVLREQGFTYDSSIPFWGVRRFKYGSRYDQTGIPELKCIPSYAFRITPMLFDWIIERSRRSLGYAVFFLHPWELVDSALHRRSLPWRRRFNFLNTAGIGTSFLENLRRFFHISKGALEFKTCRELSTMLGEGKILSTP